jgi:hypothetical protein
VVIFCLEHLHRCPEEVEVGHATLIRNMIAWEEATRQMEEQRERRLRDY